MTSKRIERARKLRKDSTDAERKLWWYLRSKQLEGLKFRRQHPIGNYIVDFVCLEKEVVIELDGGQHAVEKSKDIRRDKWLSNEGYLVLRFWNPEVLLNIEGVLEAIREACINHPLPSPETIRPSFTLPRPLPSREGGNIVSQGGGSMWSLKGGGKCSTLEEREIYVSRDREYYTHPKGKGKR